MDNEKLVKIFGSWVRVQVAFYDFMKFPQNTPPFMAGMNAARG